MYEEYECDSQGRQIAVIKPVQLDSSTVKDIQTQTIYYPEGHASEDLIQYIVYNYDSLNWAADKAANNSTRNITFEFTFSSDGEQ